VRVLWNRPGWLILCPLSYGLVAMVVFGGLASLEAEGRGGKRVYKARLDCGVEGS
jgi:hypothetical protein